MFGTRILLGLAIDDFGVVAAEVHVRAGRPEIRHTAHLAFDEKLNPNNVNELGQRLRKFLRANQFSSKQAVVGIPTKWIVTKEITAPPAIPDALTGLLGIQAERAFSLNAGELVFDYCGRTSVSEKSQVLLMAAKRQVISQVRELAGAAGLQVLSITVSALAFGKALSETGEEQRYGLYTRPTYCEFWSQSNGRLRSIKHVPVTETDGTGADLAERLGATIQRLILLSSEQNQSPPYQVTLYDACSLSGEVVDRLRKHLAPQISVSDGNAMLRSAGLSLSDHPEQSQSLAATAVAMAAVCADKLPVDFLNPRIGRKRTSSRKRVTTWAAVAAAVFVVGVLCVIADWLVKSSDIATYTEQLEQMSEQISSAREMVDRLSYAGSWTSQKPQFLECLRQLTLAFSESPRVWATSLALSENADGSVVGKTVDEQSFYEVLDKIRQNSAFSGVMMMHLRDAGGNSREKEFAVTFKFRGIK